MFPVPAGGPPYWLTSDGYIDWDAYASEAEENGDD